MLGVVVSYPHKPAVGLQVGQVQGEGGGAFGQSRRGHGVVRSVDEIDAVDGIVVVCLIPIGHARAVLVVDAACHVHVDILIKPGDDVPAVLAHHLGMQERACILAAQPDDAGVRSFTGMPQFLRSRAGEGRQRVKR